MKQKQQTKKSERKHHILEKPQTEIVLKQVFFCIFLLQRPIQAMLGWAPKNQGFFECAFSFLKKKPVPKPKLKIVTFTMKPFSFLAT